MIHQQRLLLSLITLLTAVCSTHATGQIHPVQKSFYRHAHLYICRHTLAEKIELAIKSPELPFSYEISLTCAEFVVGDGFITPFRNLHIARSLNRAVSLSFLLRHEKPLLWEKWSEYYQKLSPSFFFFEKKLPGNKNAHQEQSKPIVESVKEGKLWAKNEYNIPDGIVNHNQNPYDKEAGGTNQKEKTDERLSLGRYCKVGYIKKVTVFVKEGWGNINKLTTIYRKKEAREWQDFQYEYSEIFLGDSNRFLTLEATMTIYGGTLPCPKCLLAQSESAPAIRSFRTTDL